MKIKSKVKTVSRVQLFATPWAVACQTPPSMGFSRQECWSGLPFPSPGDLPDPGIEHGSPALQADTLPSEPPGKPFKYDPNQIPDDYTGEVTNTTYDVECFNCLKNTKGLIFLSHSSADL